MSIDSEAFFLAKKKLNDFLEKHPEMKPAQAKLEAQLNNMGSSHNKLVFLQMQMEAKVLELRKALEELLTYDIPEKK
jgi:hypothetical protein